MNRFLLTLPVLLTGLLSSCVFIQPGPEVTPPTPLRVLEATYSTNFSADGQAIICDDRVTQIIYRFRYEGALESWRSYLKGQMLGKVSGEKTFTPASPGVAPYETSGYEVTYTLQPNTAPLSVDPNTVSPQGIVVTPVPNPTPIGATELYVVLEGANGESKPFVSKPITVFTTCS